MRSLTSAGSGLCSGFGLMILFITLVNHLRVIHFLVIGDVVSLE